MTKIFKISFLVCALGFLSAAGSLASGDADAPATATEVSREATESLIKNGAQTRSVSEDEALAMAAARGLVLKPTPPESPAYGHPWVVVKAGLGTPSGINLLTEIYVHDNWAIETGGSVALSYSAITIGPRWHPDVFCWGCTGALSLTLSPGAEIGRVFSGLNRGPGTILSASGEAEGRWHPGKGSFFFSMGIRGSAGTYIEDGGSTLAPNAPVGGPGPTGPGAPGTPNMPAPLPPPELHKVTYGPKATPYGDALLYIGGGF